MAESGRQTLGQAGGRIFAQLGVEVLREKNLALRGGEPSGKMAESRLLRIILADAVIIAQIGFSLDAGGFQIRIQRLEQQRAPFGLRVTRPDRKSVV